MAMLALEDLKDCNELEVKGHIAGTFSEYGRPNIELPDDMEILIAYESVGSWGCDSSNWFLFRSQGKLWENHGSHCSCYGFENQWGPEETSLEYLQSNKFGLSLGGYDSDRDGNKELIHNYIKEMN